MTRWILKLTFVVCQMVTGHCCFAKEYVYYPLEGVEVQFNKKVKDLHNKPIPFQCYYTEYSAFDEFLYNERHVNFYYKGKTEMEDLYVELNIAYENWWMGTDFRPQRLFKLTRRDYLENAVTTHRNWKNVKFENTPLLADISETKISTCSKDGNVDEYLIHVVFTNGQNNDLSVSYTIQYSREWEVLSSVFTQNVPLPISMGLLSEKHYQTKTTDEFIDRIESNFNHSKLVYQKNEEELLNRNQAPGVLVKVHLDSILKYNSLADAECERLKSLAVAYQLNSRQLYRDLQVINNGDIATEDLKAYFEKGIVTALMDSIMVRNFLNVVASNYCYPFFWNHIHEVCTGGMERIFCNMYYRNVILASNIPYIGQTRDFSLTHGVYGQTDVLKVIKTQVHGKILNVYGHALEFITVSLNENEGYDLYYSRPEEHQLIRSNLHWDTIPVNLGNAFIFGEQLGIVMDGECYLANRFSDSLEFKRIDRLPLGYTDEFGNFSKTSVVGRAGFGNYMERYFSDRSGSDNVIMDDPYNLNRTGDWGEGESYNLDRVHSTLTGDGSAVGWALQHYISKLNGNECLMRCTVHNGKILDIFLLENKNGKAVELTFEEAQKHLMADVHFRNLLLISQMRVE